MIRLRTLALVAALVPGMAGAQEMAPPVALPQAQGFERFLFPPELVMQHQRALKLTDQQRTAITDEVKALQSRVVEFQWRIQDEQQQLQELLAGSTIVEADAVAHIERVLDLERSVKLSHFTALLRIRNALTAEQRDELMRLAPRRPDPERRAR